MSITRTENQEGPALMTIHLTTKTLPLNTVQPTFPTAEILSPTTPAAATPPLTGSIATINMKHRSESEILTQLISITKAVPTHPSQDELDQMRELEQQRNLSEKDSQRSHAVNEKRRRRDAMLAQAQSGVAAAKEA
jgi:large subunit ribosomal protein MRP49